MVCAKVWATNLRHTLSLCRQAGRLQYLKTKEFQQVVWWSYQANQPLYNRTDSVKGIRQTPVLVGPINALAFHAWTTTSHCKDVPWDFPKSNCIRGSAHDILKTVDGFEAEVVEIGK